MENPIRGEVFKKYDSISAFANAIGWKYGKASRIVKGSQRPDAIAMEQIAQCLNISDAEKFVSIFFPTLSTM